MELLIKAGQLLLSLSILVLLHELGHFIPAKLFKTRVEKFYLFFDPWFSLFKFKKGGTEYGIGWLPLGGYVKIAGMIDESMDKEQLDKEPEPWEFRSKPAWQRLIIMIGGVTVNIILACFIYACILMTWGEEKLPTANLKYGLECVDSLAFDLGFEHGDNILFVGETPVEFFGEIMPKLLLEEANSVTVLRNGAETKIEYSSEGVGRIIRNESQLFVPRSPIIVNQIKEGSPADLAGLKRGDFLVGMDSIPFQFYEELLQISTQKAGHLSRLTIVRDGQNMELEIIPDGEGKFGFYRVGTSISELKEFGVISTVKKQYGFLESLPAGVNKAGEKLSNYIKQFKLIFNSETEAYKQVGGFGAMAKMFSPTWDWLRFWEMTAFLSIMLAFMNILPIPALDGGHVLFLLYEIVTRRKPNEKFMEYAQMAGMILLLALLVLANGNDILKVFQ